MKSNKIISLIILNMLAFTFLAIASSKNSKEESVKSWIRNQPVKFLENKGQMMNSSNVPVPFVLFKASSSGIDVYITETGLTYVFARRKEHYESNEHLTNAGIELETTDLEKSEIEMSWVNVQLFGAAIKKENIIREGPKAEEYNYFYPHCSDGIYGVKKYEKITILNVYPGIDWVLYNSDAKGFKYDFIVHQGAQSSQIKLIYDSAQPLIDNSNGSITVNTPLGTLTENAPFSYLKENDKEIQSSFKLKRISQHKSEVSFEIDEYNLLSNTLIIDPQLLWGTYMGGTGGSISNEGTMDITIDRNNNVYACGYVVSTNFPTINPGAGAYYDNTLGGTTDGLILKFSNAGVLIWCTFYGGSDTNENLNSIVTDAANNVYITGVTPSTNFPVLNLAGAYNDNTSNGGSDALVLKFSPTGVRLWATYFGGSGNDFGNSIKVDALNNVFVTGSTSSANFPTQNLAGAYNDNTITGTDVFMLRFSPAGALQWSTFFGGSSQEIGNALWVGAGNKLCVTGYTNSTDFPLLNNGGYFDNTQNGSNDVFVTTFNSFGVLQWSTYLGGNLFDEATDIEEDVFGNLYVTGTTVSANFPTQNLVGAYYDNTNNNYDLFLTKFNASSVLTWSTFVGGTGMDVSYYTANSGYRTKNLVTDSCGVVYIGGWTGSTDFPTINTCGTFFNNSILGPQDLVLVEFAPSGAMIYSTYFGTLGGSQDFRANLAIDRNRNLFVTGEWMGASSNALANPGAGAFYNNYTSADDVYIIKLKPDKPNFTVSQVNASGCGCGSATATINCAFPPFNFRWSNGNQTINTISNSNTVGLCAGNYWVEITDALCNRDTLYFTITGVANGLSNSISNTNPNNCNAIGTGTATANSTGGTPAYTYLWSNGQTTKTATGLAAGNYTLTVRDQAGCSVVQTVTINSPSGPSLSTSSTNNACNSVGSASVVSTIGIQPYTYSWSNGVTTTTASGLSSGNYTVTVTDGNACTKTQNFVISGVNPVSASFTMSPSGSACVGTNVIFTSTGSAGTGITYNWLISVIQPTNVSGTSTNFSYTFLTAGTYTVAHTVTQSGCSTRVSQTINIINCSGPTVTTSTSSICPGGCATITSSTSGGANPYTYSWSNGSTTQNISPCPIATSTYTITVRDAGGTTSTSTATVTVNPTVTVTTNSNAINCNGGTGSATATGGGGTPSFTYNWSNGQGGATSTGLTAGGYTVTVTDSKGCSAISSTSIISPQPLIGQFAKGTANCIGCGCKEWVMVNAGGGTSPYTYTWPDGYANRNKNQLCPGNYLINIQDKNGCNVNVNISTP